MVAAWLAAGSTGLLGHPLQHALTWLALAVALVAGWPRENQSFGTWAILAGSAVFSLLLTASSLPAVNVLAVAIVLAAMAQVSRGLTGRVAADRGPGRRGARAVSLRLRLDSLWFGWPPRTRLAGDVGRLADRPSDWKSAQPSAGSISWSSWRRSTPAG